VGFFHFVGHIKLASVTLSYLSLTWSSAKLFFFLRTGDSSNPSPPLPATVALLLIIAAQQVSMFIFSTLAVRRSKLECLYHLLRLAKNLRINFPKTNTIAYFVWLSGTKKLMLTTGCQAGHLDPSRNLFKKLWSHFLRHMDSLPRFKHYKTFFSFVSAFVPDKLF